MSHTLLRSQRNSKFLSRLQTGENINHTSHVSIYLFLFSGPSWPGPASELGLAKEVEVEPEPYCFPVFRWSLILVGLAMLVCVFVVLVQLLVDWGRG